MAENKRFTAGRIVLVACLWIWGILQAYIAVRHFQRNEEDVLFEVVTAVLILLIAVYVTARSLKKASP